VLLDIQSVLSELALKVTPLIPPELKGGIEGGTRGG